MPITQQKMLEILSAADRINSSFTEFRTLVRNEFDETVIRDKDPQDALFRIIDGLSTCQPDAQDIATILEELRHYRHMWQRNVRKADNMRRIRQKLGRPQVLDFDIGKD